MLKIPQPEFEGLKAQYVRRTHTDLSYVGPKIHDYAEEAMK